MSIKDYFSEANDWESTVRGAEKRSNRLAWRISTICMILVALLIVAFTALLPLKESIPYVIYVDKTTGVPDIVSVLNMEEVQYEEVRDKYFLAQYTKARETYDGYTIQKDYDLVNLMSSALVAKEYQALFEGSTARDVIYGNSVKISIEVLSVVPNAKGIGTVRFIRRQKRVDESGSGQVTKWVATIGYEYQPTSKLLESSRLQNPFGFQVVSFRIDPETGVREQ